MKIPESKHFVLEPVEEGIFAAVHREEGWAIANAGIVDLGDDTVVFDTFMTPAAAVDLRRTAELVTGKPVSKVINSHYHNDHIWGNQVFLPDSSILSTVETRQLIQTSGQEEYDWYSENSKARLDALLEAFEAETDKEKRAEMRVWISYFESLVESMPNIQICLADSTFEEELEIRGTERSVKLTAFADGHTGNDTILHISSDGIIFMGDLLFVECHPYLADGDPENLMKVLGRIQRLNADVFVPGHGPIGDQGDVEMMVDYVATCFEEVEALVKKGIDPAEIPTLPVPKQFSSWKFPNFFEANIRWLYRQMVNQ